MGSNKRVREDLEQIYGKICMLHKGLKINGYSRSKVKYAGKSIEQQLTLHHIIPKSKGGKTNLENGAVLCRGCHEFLEQTTPQNREKINKLLKRYKECVVAYGDDFNLGLEIELAEIELTDKELLVTKKEKYNRAKEKAEMEKIRKEFTKDEDI